MLGSQSIDVVAFPPLMLMALMLAGCGDLGADPGATGVSNPQLAPVHGIVGDDFSSGALEPSSWDVVDPQGDGTVEVIGAGTPDAQLLLSVPAGTVHDAWKTNTSLRAMQPAADEDFEIEVKFESEPTERYQGQGILVEQDASNYLRFDVYSNGSSLRVFSATFTNGSPTVRVSGDRIATGPTTYLRLARSADQWTARYSYDGLSWVTAGSFSHALTVSSVGVFASNFKPNPAYTAVVDYFYETSAPVAPEDPPLCDSTDALVLTTQATNGSIVRDPALSSYGCGDVVTLTATPDVGATFLGWGGALSGTTNPTSLTIDADTTVTANFSLDTTPPQMSNVSVAPSYTSAAVSWQTDELSDGWVEYGLTTSYELGTVASGALSVAHVVTLPNLAEGETYHYRVTAEDSLGNAASSNGASFVTSVSECSLVLTTQATNGSIVRDPALSSYGCGDVVTLTATPDVGATFLGWGGALSGTTNPTSLTIDADTTVTANFSLDTTPPQMSNVSVAPSYTSAAVSWQTDELSDGWVEYGLTTSYELGTVASGALSVAHVVTLPNLAEGETYHYRVTAEDSLGNAASSNGASFVTSVIGGGTGGSGGSGTSPSVMLSDDFSGGVLEPSLWDVVDPQGDGTVEVIGAGTPDAQLLLSVPAGTVHDPWKTNTALRAMQPAADEDFEIEVKFESEPTERYQGQGILVEQDASNYLRFDVYSNGSSLRVFSATFTNGSPTVRVSGDRIATGPTTYLRLARSADQWTARYSYDGLSWVTAGSFSHALTVSSVGVFASNFEPNPAYTAVVDYFFDTASPIYPEDTPSCTLGDQFTIAAGSTGPGVVTQDPALSSYGCGDVVTLTATPDVGAAFLGWGGALSGTTNPTSLTIDADTTVTANFSLDTTPPQMSNVSVAPSYTSAAVSWQTDELSDGWVEYGLTTSYELGTVASGALSVAHVVTLPNLAEGETYHYRVTAEDSLGNAASSNGASFVTSVSGDGPFIDVWYGDYQVFGALGEPQQWVNVFGQVLDPDGLSALNYSLNGSQPRSLSVGPSRRLAEPGDFNVDIDFAELSPGANTIEIRAVDGLGFETVKEVVIDYASGNVWPADFQVDWSSAAQIADVAQIVDGRWSIVGGELRNDLQRYDRLVAIGDIAWTDYEVTVPVTVHGVDPAGFAVAEPGLGVMLKWPGHSDWNGAQPAYGWYPAGGGGWLAVFDDGTTELRLDDFAPGGVFRKAPRSNRIAIGTTYMWKVRVESQPDGRATYSVKVWATDVPEPAAWDIVDTEDADVPGGSLLLVSHFADVGFGNVIIEPL